MVECCCAAILLVQVLGVVLTVLVCFEFNLVCLCWVEGGISTMLLFLLCFCCFGLIVLLISFWLLEFMFIGFDGSVNGVACFGWVVLCL